MPRTSRGSALLFWLMFLTGGAALALCLVLPPWLQYQALLQLRSETESRVASVETRLQTVTKQIEHLRNDEAYIERVGRKDLGLTTPGVETIPLRHMEPLDSQPAASAGTDDEPPSDLSKLVTDAIQRYPLASVFVLDQTRPIVMAMSGALVVAAIVLLWRPGPIGKRQT